MLHRSVPPPIVLSFAGFDPSAGAGLLSDLRVWQDLGLWGMSLCGVLTAQNSLKVEETLLVDPVFLQNQLDCLQADFTLSGLKIGLFGALEQAKVIADLLKTFEGPKILDPVLVSSSGHAFLGGQGIDFLTRQMLPHLDLLTPNLAEATSLTGIQVTNLAQMRQAARILVCQLNCPAVLIKGGHLTGAPTDYYLSRTEEHLFTGERITGRDPHGTGCLLSAAILGFKCLGSSWLEAIEKAKIYSQKAIKQACQIGQGKPYWR